MNLSIFSTSYFWTAHFLEAAKVSTFFELINIKTDLLNFLCFSEDSTEAFLVRHDGMASLGGDSQRETQAG